MKWVLVYLLVTGTPYGPFYKNVKHETTFGSQRQCYQMAESLKEIYKKDKIELARAFCIKE
jgi:hypothetical protein